MVAAAKLMLRAVARADRAGVVEIEHALRRVGRGEADYPHPAIGGIVAGGLGDLAARIDREGGRKPVRPASIIVELGAVGAGGAAPAGGRARDLAMLGLAAFGR